MRRSACAILIATGILLVASGALAAEGQLVLVPDPRLLIGLLLLFAFLIPPVQAALFTPLLRVLEERTERIDGTRRRASRRRAQYTPHAARAGWSGIGDII